MDRSICGDVGTLGQNGATVYKARLWGHIPDHIALKHGPIYMVPPIFIGTSKKSLEASGQLRMNLDPAVNK